MKKTLSWFLLNMFTIGTLTLGYYTGEMGLTGGLIGVYEVIILSIIFVFLAISVNDSEKESIVKIKKSLAVKDAYKFSWRTLLEPFIIYWVYRMGYSKITILMFLTFVIGNALTMRAYTLRKELKGKEEGEEESE